MPEMKTEVLVRVAQILADAREKDMVLFRNVSDLIHERARATEKLKDDDEIEVKMTAGDLRRIRSFMVAYADAEQILGVRVSGG